MSSYLTDVNTWFDSPTKSTSRKFSSMFTGLLEPCFSVIFEMCNGSMDTKLIRGSPLGRIIKKRIIFLSLVRGRRGWDGWHIPLANFLISAVLVSRTQSLSPCGHRGRSWAVEHMRGNRVRKLKRRTFVLIFYVFYVMFCWFVDYIIYYQ